jgi:hypothetical protein
MEQNWRAFIKLNKEDMLVIPLTEYYTSSKDSDKLNLNMHKDETIDVGFIDHIGEDIPEEWLGKVIYYHKDVATKINLKGIGHYDLVPISLKLIVRLDQFEKIIYTYEYND